MPVQYRGSMSVFTAVDEVALQGFLQDYPQLGVLHALKPITSGIENSNFFLDVDAGSFVLTLFETVGAADLPYFLGLMAFLAGRGLPVPQPVVNRQGTTWGTLCGRPAALVSRLPGMSLEQPDAAACRMVGAFLGQMHLLARDFPMQRCNARDLAWCQQTAQRLLAHLSPEERSLVCDELRFQASVVTTALPQGPIHGDLFCDNVLFDAGHIGGVIDFYYACNEAWLYDLAVMVNDWCRKPAGTLDGHLVEAVVQGYTPLRPLSVAERCCWGAMLRRAALRFWLSRAADWHFPRPGPMTYQKDPLPMRALLEQHRTFVAELPLG